MWLTNKKGAKRGDGGGVKKRKKKKRAKSRAEAAKTEEEIAMGGVRSKIAKGTRKAVARERERGMCCRNCHV